ncbi:MAG: SDR family NAD(P)-dependent oxidoreductase [Alphaproteobacteria bacterium]|nr:SDR family NAD(P)-dependent oxidoreductase [Alphaproteobacteria bacterium]
MGSVVITGVSTGIGWGATKVLIKKGHRVFGSVRKAADAERLQKEFGDKFVPLIFDVTDAKAVQEGAAKVREALKGETLMGLVNNAGIAISGPLLYLPVDEMRTQMEVNLIGVLNVTQAFAPLLGADKSLKGKPGRIVNISSVGGKRAFPFIGPYAASKHALEGFSESLRRELMLFGIDVIIIGPGAVKTAIWDKAEQIDISRYANTPYGPSVEQFSKFFVNNGRTVGLAPEKLGRVILRALTTARPKVRYAVVPNFIQDRLVPALMPKRMLDRVIAGRLGFTKAN